VATPGGAEGLGSLLQGYTESSNVSVVTEFINLIVAQRGLRSQLESSEGGGRHVFAGQQLNSMILLAAAIVSGCLAVAGDRIRAGDLAHSVPELAALPADTPLAMRPFRGRGEF